MRLVKIDGELNGHKFQVKPRTPKATIIEKELQKEMKEWHEKNNKEFLEFTKKYDKELADGDFDSLPDDIPESKEWIEDEEFRSKRYKKMADHCMEFQKAPPASLWKSDELEISVIEEAWDFFTGKRRVPSQNTFAR